ncbi:MAG: hypothetical protein V1658_00880, partial [Candidatus Micrarchaeota archaeon]
MRKAQGSLEFLMLLAAAFAFLCLLISLSNSLGMEAKFELGKMDARIYETLACGATMSGEIKFQFGEYSGSSTKCGTNYRLYHQKIS